MEAIRRRVLIVEDHPVVAQSIAANLREIDSALDIHYADHANAALAALHLELRVPWFRLFLDIEIPGASGLAVLRRCAQLRMASRCVVVTGTSNMVWIDEVRRLGMLGVINKSLSVDAFRADLHLALRGKPVYRDQPPADAVAAVALTPRQHDMLCLLQRGYTSKKIAIQLGLSIGTVDNHILGLMRVLGVSSRMHAVLKALELGYRYD